MVDYVDEFPDDEILDTLGDSIMHVSNANVTIHTKAVLEFDVLIDEYKTERRNEIELLKSNFPDGIFTGDVIVHKGKTYRLDKQIFHDERYQRWELVDA